MADRGRCGRERRDCCQKLEKARRSGNGWVTCCPAHDDKNASLSLTDGADGKVLAKCHARLLIRGRSLRTLLKRGISLHSRRFCEFLRQAGTGDGMIIAMRPENFCFSNCRFEAQRFTQRQPDGKGGWQWNSPRRSGSCHIACRS